jgi:Fur family ferric uptake transcriptional regulator
MIEFQNPAIDEVIRDVCARHQFQSTGHSFIIRGTCGDCNRARSAKRRLDLI